MLWGTQLVRRVYNNGYGRTPWDCHGQDINNPHIDTDGYVAEVGENNVTLYQVIEDATMSRTLAQLIRFGGYIDIYDHDSFASWTSTVTNRDFHECIRWSPRQDIEADFMQDACTRIIATRPARNRTRAAWRIREELGAYQYRAITPTESGYRMRNASRSRFHVPPSMIRNRKETTVRTPSHATLPPLVSTIALTATAAGCANKPTATPTTNVADSQAALDAINNANEITATKSLLSWDDFKASDLYKGDIEITDTLTNYDSATTWSGKQGDRLIPTGKPQ